MGDFKHLMTVPLDDIKVCPVCKCTEFVNLDELLILGLTHKAKVCVSCKSAFEQGNSHVVCLPWDRIDSKFRDAIIERVSYKSEW